MENRFGVKDFVLYALVVALFVVVVLAMFQFDRQNDRVVRIETQLGQVATDLNRISRGGGLAPQAQANAATAPTTQSAVALSGGPVAPADGKLDAFSRLREAEAMPEFARGGTLRRDFQTRIPKLTPLVAGDATQATIEGQVMDTLAVRDLYTSEYVPRLAESFEQAPDGLTITFKLRPGLLFSDGSPLTSDDVVYTFDLVRNPDVQADRARVYLTKLTAVEAPDPLTVVFRFSTPQFNHFETVGGISIMCKEFYSRYKPNDLNEKPGLMLGSGPYRLETPDGWSPDGSTLTLVRNERYWGVPPAFDRISYDQTETESVAVTKYGNGETDFLSCTPEMYVRGLANPQVAGRSASVEYTSAYGGYRYVGWNQRKLVDGQPQPTAFADVRVRRAMTMLIDRDRLVREVMLGYATVTSGPFAPEGEQNDKALAPLPYDPEAAVALLKEAGYEDRDGDGVVEDASGKALRFTLLYPSGNTAFEKIVLAMRDGMQRGKVRMEAERLEWKVLLQRIVNTDFDACILGWTASPEIDAGQFFHTDAIAGQGDNRNGYSSPECDRLIDAARGTVDRAERMKLWRQLHKVLHDDQPYTFLFFNKALGFHDKRLANVKPSKLGLNYEAYSGSTYPWFLPAGQQRPTMQ